MVNLSVRKEGAFAVLMVEDTGPGIAVSEGPRVFDPFYRILGSDAEGSGFGLSIVRAIADSIEAIITLGDRCNADSAPGLRLMVRFSPATTSPAGNTFAFRPT